MGLRPRLIYGQVYEPLLNGIRNIMAHKRLNDRHMIARKGKLSEM